MKTTTSILGFTLALILVSDTDGFGSDRNHKWSGGLHFNSGLSQGDLKEQIGRDATGSAGRFFYSPQRHPLALGLELSWMNYGSETRREPFSTTIPDVTVDVTTSNNIVQTLFVLRGRALRGPIELYGDAVLGFNYMYTETGINGTGISDEDVVRHTNFDDAALAYGGGGGVMVPVFTRKKLSEGQKPLQVLIDGGVRYLKGGEAEYLKKGSIRREGTTVTFDTLKSETDLLKVHVGLVVRF
jgi:hypothetical protein